MLLQSYHAAKQLYNITEQQSSIAYTFAACTMSPSNCTINHINIIALHIMPLQPVPCRQATVQYNRATEYHFKPCFCSLYHAAKQLEGALLVCREQGKLEEVLQPKENLFFCPFETKKTKMRRRKQPIWSQVEELASRGGLLYRQAGNPESAAQMLVTSL